MFSKLLVMFGLLFLVNLFLVDHPEPSVSNPSSPAPTVKDLEATKRAAEKAEQIEAASNVWWWPVNRETKTREKPADDAPIWLDLSQSRPYKVMEEHGDWVSVRLGHIQGVAWMGWVRKSELSRTRDATDFATSYKRACSAVFDKTGEKFEAAIDSAACENTEITLYVTDSWVLMDERLKKLAAASFSKFALHTFRVEGFSHSERNLTIKFIHQGSGSEVGIWSSGTYRNEL